MKVALIANGQWNPEWGRKELAESQIDLLIGVDGGTNIAVAAGRVPDVVIGDLDSINAENLSKCRDNNTIIKKYPKEKNETDLELAMEYAEFCLQSKGKPEDEIVLYAAGGKRLDHLLGNIALMLGWAQKNRTIRMVDKNYQAWVMLPGTKVICGSKGQELSLIALSEEARITSKGLYYELDELTLLQISPRGISNVFENEQAEIILHQGIILVVLLRD